jgi:prolyl 4-hydroxylase
MTARHPELTQAIALSSAGRNAEAVLIINRLAGQNDSGALAMLAEMKWRGGIVPQNVAEGRELYRRAGEAGHVAAAFIYTNLLASGVAGRRDWPLAMKRLKEEARANPKRRQMIDLIRKMLLTAEGDPSETPQGWVISESPHVTSFPALFSPTECDYLRAAAEAGFAPSTVNTANGQAVADPMRTSDGSTFHWLIEDPLVHALNRRLAAASGTEWDQGEAIQILRYRPGQEYRPHYDFVRATENQRFRTILVYLNQDYVGGETCFIKTGLKVKGRRGEAIQFSNATASRDVDPMSEHAGLPVTRGKKYLASRWIREAKWVP